MAEISIPEPDANGYRHFTYTTTDPETGQWYGGKRSTKKHPLSDPYKGSGNWIKKHPARGRLHREIVAFYTSSAEVFAAEAEMVTWEKVFDDPLCKNERPGGEGMTAEAANVLGPRLAGTPKWRAAQAASAKRRSANPAWRANNSAQLGRLHADLNWLAGQTTRAKTRAEDPKWLANNSAAKLRRAAEDPEWAEAQSAAMRRMRNDPTLHEKRTAGLQRAYADPDWRATNLAMLRRVHADPQVQEKQAAALRRACSTPEWRDAQLAGCRRLVTIFVDLNGTRVSLADACRETGVPYGIALARRKAGWSESRWFIGVAPRRSAASGW